MGRGGVQRTDCVDRAVYSGDFSPTLCAQKAHHLQSSCTELLQAADKYMSRLRSEFALAMKVYPYTGRPMFSDIMTLCPPCMYCDLVTLLYFDLGHVR